MNNNNPFNRNPQNPQGNMQTNRPPQYGQQNQQYQQYQQQAPFGQQNPQQNANMFDRQPSNPTKLKFHPSPLQSKILGFVVLAIAGFLMGRAWLKPEIPEELQNYGNPSPTVPVNNRAPEVKKPAPNPQEPIVLSSLQEMESDNGAPPPALENPNDKNPSTITPNLRANTPTANTAPVVIEPEVVEEEPQARETVNREEQRKKEEQAKREREKKQAEAKKQQQKKKEEQAKREREREREREKKQAEKKAAEKKAAERKQAEKKKAPPAPKLELTSNKSNNQASSAKKGEKADKWIYVGVYAKKENVDRAVARLRKNNFPVKVATLKDGKTRVSVGPYRDSEVAGIRKKLNAIGGF
ncbi:MAG: SPOR domain-containing protein [Cardiobacteriaceae bacterium]|nr:SPOR domain-containing protein [Cardiobacteriaceae bacterium]